MIASTSIFVAYLIVLFPIVVDLLRDDRMGGGSKAIWILGLVFLPLLTAVIYILARGAGMAGQFADAKALLDAGTINADEFAKLKAKALA